VHPNERTGGPYLIAVFFCEKTLREIDGILSFVRVVDRFTITGPGESMNTTILPLTVVIMAKSGTHRGTGQITLTPTTPSGQQMPALPIQVLFEGDDDRAVAAMGTIGFPVSEPGAYWFDVALDGMPLTRTAIRVVYMRNPMVQMQHPSVPPG
jgi:hypothetical protein